MKKARIIPILLGISLGAYIGHLISIKITGESIFTCTWTTEQITSAFIGSCGLVIIFLAVFMLVKVIKDTKTEA